jgi:hypothetical protein
MAVHFPLLAQFTEMVDGPGIDVRDAGERILVMQMFLKCADLAGAARPFDVAEKWAEAICEEAAKYHESDTKPGKLFLNDRLEFKKQRLQIRFYNIICLPLYAAMAKAYPPLEVNLNAVKRNLDVWKMQAEPVPDQD